MLLQSLPGDDGVARHTHVALIQARLPSGRDRRGSRHSAAPRCADAQLPRRMAARGDGSAVQDAAGGLPDGDPVGRVPSVQHSRHVRLQQTR